MSIFIRTVPNVMRQYGCTADNAQRFIDLRDEGYSTHQAALLAGLSDPPEEVAVRPRAVEPSGETMDQREEVCAAWHELPDDLRKDPRLTRLYHALGGPRMDDPGEAAAGGPPIRSLHVNLVCRKHEGLGMEVDLSRPHPFADCPHCAADGAGGTDA